PPGLTLNATSGELAGYPSEVGMFEFCVQVTDPATGGGLPFLDARKFAITIGQ
ncbi:MAG: putative Ig domain-containing protein, partial [Ardenticatenaceae bacterium]